MMKGSCTYDACQQRVIEACGGWHLVLAPPGCGKTQILTERIRYAHAQGVAYGDMLCLTFTNRAARGMMERMDEHLADPDAAQVYVGNVHRFCSRFLFDNSLVASDASVIDEDDTVSVIARFLNEDEMAVAQSYSRRRAYAEVVHVAALMHQVEHGHPKALRLHPECLDGDDVKALAMICQRHADGFSPRAMMDVYAHTDTYRDLMGAASLEAGHRTIVDRVLAKLSLAWQYAQYKHTNHLLDFEDLLLLTYDALSSGVDCHRYAWIQVDEVQYLNPLQLALVERLVSPRLHTLMLLGDEQQAIFSFMGAKLSTLDQLKQRCQGHIHHLDVNHRSRSYLLNVFNTYASHILHIDKALLPVADNEEQAQPADLTIMQSENVDSELVDVVRRTQRLLQEDDRQTTAVIVSANSDADAVSDAMQRAAIPHFKVSGSDLFSQPGMKLLLAHLNVLSRDTDFLSWACLLKGLGVFDQSYAARNFVRASLNHAILPADYLRPQGGTCLASFAQAYDEDELVVFDTETTGLDIFHDDIIQIAAVIMRQGQVVPGSALSLYISTQRDIPAMLGDVVNPIIEERRRHELLAPQVALRRFIEYVGRRPLLGHNAAYDYHILDNNLRRYCPDIDLAVTYPVCFDSLVLIRLLRPDLKVFKLKALLAALNLEGENSHLADDDVNATCSLVGYCRQRARMVLPAQRQFMQEDRVTRRVRVLRARYASVFMDARQRMYQCLDEEAQPAIVQELLRFHQLLTDAQYIPPVEGLHYVLNYLRDDLLRPSAEPSLKQQLDNHLMQLNTMKEADLCNSASLGERVFVTTVHKAKGLEFDNVIVFDCVDGRWPNFYSEGSPARLAEDARKFYVAITRATRRLVIAWSRNKTSYNGYTRPQSMTRFMAPLLPLFNG